MNTPDNTTKSIPRTWFPSTRRRPSAPWLASGLAAGLIALAGCAAVGPDYERPSVDAPAAYKAADLGYWKEGQPRDRQPKGRWWEAFGDEVLNRLQDRAREANQDLKAAFAVLNQARAVARTAQSELYPSLDLNPGFRRERFSPNQEPDFGALTANTYLLPLDLSYELDLWGRVRRGFESARAEAEASEAAFHSLSLSLQADVARNYFELRALDAEIEVQERALNLRKERVDIVASRLEAGLGTELDVERANTEWAAAEAELAALNRRRTGFENALAILTGTPSMEFRIAAGTVASGKLPEPPAVPAGLPSDLLERRPDIAEAERQLAADNARIGVAKAAFFPAIRLTGSGGYLSAEAENLFNWESRVWSIGPSISLPIFAGGRNVADLRRSKARHEESVARYRQRVLVAFAEVEDALAGVHFLATQAAAQDRAFASAVRARDLALESFTAGLSDYLDVIEADRTALQSQRARLELDGQRLVATVHLIKALGGGWEQAPLTAYPLLPAPTTCQFAIFNLQ